MLATLNRRIASAITHEGQAVEQVAVAVRYSSQREVIFHYREPKKYVRGLPVQTLLLMPGFNGDGAANLRDAAWTEFADRENLLLVGPTFLTDLTQIHSRKGYYYAELGSGQATLDALAQIGRKTGVKIDRVYLFGFSAGAHFVHRFANWRPNRVAGFVAYSAGWWDAPVGGLKNVPALILCGEDDERYGPTQAYYRCGHDLGCPWIWRGYPQTGHEITPSIVKMAQAFLHHYRAGEKGEPLVGDSQTYESFPADSEEARNIPEEIRVPLPSQALAEVWKQP